MHHRFDTPSFRAAEYIFTKFTIISDLFLRLCKDPVQYTRAIFREQYTSNKAAQKAAQKRAHKKGKRIRGVLTRVQGLYGAFLRLAKKRYYHHSKFLRRAKILGALKEKEYVLIPPLFDLMRNMKKNAWRSEEVFAPIMSARDNKTQIELPLILNGLFFLHCVLFFMYDLKNELITDRHFLRSRLVCWIKPQLLF